VAHPGNSLKIYAYFENQGCLSGTRQLEIDCPIWVSLEGVLSQDLLCFTMHCEAIMNQDMRYGLGGVA